MIKDSISDFALSVGIMCGSLTNPKVKEYLIARKVTPDEINAAYDIIVKIAGAFYREPE